MKQALVVFLSQTKVRAIKAWLKNDQVFKTEVLDGDLASEADLANFLLTVKKQFKLNQCKLLLDHGALFIDLLTWPAEEKPDEAKLLENIKTLIPARLDGDLIKWSERGEIKDESGSKKLIQFLVIDKEFWAKVQADFKQANIEIINFEPVFASLLRLTAGNDEPHLIRVKDHRLIVFHGVMYAAARIIAGNDELKEEQALIDYAQERWGLKVKKIVNADFDQVLLNSFLDDDSCCQDDRVESEEKKNYWWVAALLFLIVLIVSCVVYWQQLWALLPGYFSSDSESVQEEVLVEPELVIEETIEESAKETVEGEASPSATLPPRSEIKISILNGSGISGLAGLLEDWLMTMEYEDDLIEVGNASRSDYQRSVLVVSPEKKAVADLLYSDLQSKMDLDIEVEVSNNYSLDDLDVIIILGKEGESINEEN